MKLTHLFATFCIASLALAEDDGKLTIDIPSAVQAVIAKEKGDTGKVRDFKRVNESDGTTYLVAREMGSGDKKEIETLIDAEYFSIFSPDPVSLARTSRSPLAPSPPRPPSPTTTPTRTPQAASFHARRIR